MYKPSGNPKVIELTKSCRDRHQNLDAIKPIKLEELNENGKPRKLCAWCAAEEISGNRKYCCDDCSTSAMAWAYPQKEDSLRFLLIRQDWKCAHCQFDYRPFMEAIVDKDRRMNGGSLDFNRLSWYYFKRLKRAVPKERKPEVDHIVALKNGGTALGLENHQVLCYTDHKAKTKIDLSGKRINDLDE